MINKPPRFPLGGSLHVYAISNATLNLLWDISKCGWPHGARGQSNTPHLNEASEVPPHFHSSIPSSIFAPCARWLRPITRARRRDLRAKKERETCLGKVRLPSDRKRLGRDAVARALYILGMGGIQSQHIHTRKPITNQSHFL